MGLSESTLKPFSFLSHCKVSCVSILTLQWLSSPHNLVQHGESHDTLQ